MSSFSLVLGCCSTAAAHPQGLCPRFLLCWVAARLRRLIHRGYVLVFSCAGLLLDCGGSSTGAMSSFSLVLGCCSTAAAHPQGLCPRFLLCWVAAQLRRLIHRGYVLVFSCAG